MRTFSLLCIFSILIFSADIKAHGEIFELKGDIVEYYLNTLIKEISPVANEGYKLPNEENIKSFAEVFRLILDGNDKNLLIASSKATAIGYEIIRFQQTDNFEFLILKEKLSESKNGWGSYFINRNAETEIIIESPYPLHHINSGLLSVVVFKELRAKALLLPGAHRFSSSIKKDGIPISDIGLSEISIFNTVHQILADSGKFIIQFQGYNKLTNKEIRKNYPPIILTNCFVQFDVNNIKLKNTELLNILKNNLNDITFDFEKENYNACLYGEEGVFEDYFSGKDNVQWNYLKSFNKDCYFIIFFIESNLRIFKLTQNINETVYKNFSKIANSIKKTIASYKVESFEVIESKIVEKETEIEPQQKADIVVPIQTSVEKNIIKDVTLLTTIFIIIVVSLISLIIIMLLTLIKYRGKIKSTNNRIKKLEAYNKSLENEVENIKKINNEIEENYNYEIKRREESEKYLEKERKDKLHFFEGYNRLVTEKWELEKRLDKIEEELRDKKNKYALDLEYLKTNEKGIPLSISELIKIYDELIYDNRTLKDNIRKNKLIKLMTDENVKNRITCILIAGELKQKQTLKNLLEIASKDSDEKVCCVAIWALGEIGEKDSAYVLLKIVNKKNSNIYKYCINALCKIGYNFKNEGLKYVDVSTNLPDKDDIYKYSGFVSRDNFLKFIFENSDEDIRIFGIKILEKYGVELNLPIIFNILKDKSSDARYEAVRVLGNVKFVKDSKLLIDIDLKNKIIDLLNTLMKEEKSIYVRRIAVESLKKIML